MLLDVGCDLLLERLQLVVQPLGRHRFLRLPDQPRGRRHSRLPGGLLGVGVARAAMLRLGHLDLVQVHVGVLAALLLVEFEPYTPIPKLLGALADVLAERRVLLAVIVPDHVTDIAPRRTDFADISQRDHGLHVRPGHAG
jgi:hypothetical protein